MDGWPLAVVFIDLVDDVQVSVWTDEGAVELEFLCHGRPPDV